MRSPLVRMKKELRNIRLQHKNNLSQALNGMNIHEVDIDKIWAKRLRNMNIVEEYFGKR